MKNKTPLMDQRGQTKFSDWRCLEEEDDFLTGIIPSEPVDIWEDEE